MVVHLPAREAPGGGGWPPPSGGAWVHLDEQGKVRAFTGKVDVGQGTRTALALLVAEELGAGLDRVDVVMGDTDLCPWDIGTFGSRSMPDAAPALRAVARGARTTLMDLARARLSDPHRPLKAGNGAVKGPGKRTGVPLEGLLRGERHLVQVSPDVEVTPARAWRIAGHRAVDPDAVDVVTGRRRYVSDLLLPSMGYGAVLLPPTYGSRLGRVDASALSNMRSVELVEEKGFVGVVARSPREAHIALGRLRAQWLETAQPREIEIEAYLRAHRSSGDDWDTEERRTGDPDAALRRATHRVRGTYRTAYIAHVPLETRTALAYWERERVTIFLGSQTPFRARDQVARGLGVALEDVRIVSPYTGGAFGGKHGGDVALAAARLSRGVGRPVRLSFSREEEFRYGYFRPMAIIDAEAGARTDGRLMGWVFHNLNAGAAALLPPYRIEDQRVDNELSRSPLPQGPYRALAANANNFARESILDELATLTKLDPLEFRRRNLDDERLLTVMERATDAAGWPARSSRPGRGHGLAIGREKGGRVATVAEVTVDAERRLRVDRLVTAFEAGAIVHPEGLKSQVEGASVMALGGALFEAIHFDQGQVSNPRLSEYRVPRFSDLPKLETILVDRPDQPPAGAGESPMIAVAPAISNAIFMATGVRLRSLPLLIEGRVPVA